MTRRRRTCLRFNIHFRYMCLMASVDGVPHICQFLGKMTAVKSLFSLPFQTPLHLEYWNLQNCWFSSCYINAPCKNILLNLRTTEAVYACLPSVDLLWLGKLLAYCFFIFTQMTFNWLNHLNKSFSIINA